MAEGNNLEQFSQLLEEICGFFPDLSYQIFNDENHPMASVYLNGKGDSTFSEVLDENPSERQLLKFYPLLFANYIRTGEGVLYFVTTLRQEAEIKIETMLSEARKETRALKARRIVRKANRYKSILDSLPLKIDEMRKEGKYNFVG